MSHSFSSDIWFGNFYSAFFTDNAPKFVGLNVIYCDIDDTGNVDLEKLNIFSNDVTANFLLLNFDKCKFSANYIFNKLQSKGIILRSTENGYNIKNKLRLSIGSKKENIKLIKVIKNIFNWLWKMF